MISIAVFAKKAFRLAFAIILSTMLIININSSNICVYDMQVILFLSLVK